MEINTIKRGGEENNHFYLFQTEKGIFIGTKEDGKPKRIFRSMRIRDQTQPVQVSISDLIDYGASVRQEKIDPKDVIKTYSVYSKLHEEDVKNVSVLCLSENGLVSITPLSTFKSKEGTYFINASKMIVDEGELNMEKVITLDFIYTGENQMMIQKQAGETIFIKRDNVKDYKEYLKQMYEKTKNYYFKLCIVTMATTVENYKVKGPITEIEDDNVIVELFGMDIPAPPVEKTEPPKLDIHGRKIYKNDNDSSRLIALSSMLGNKLKYVPTSDYNQVKNETATVFMEKFEQEYRIEKTDSANEIKRKILEKYVSLYELIEAGQYVRMKPEKIAQLKLYYDIFLDKDIDRTEKILKLLNKLWEISGLEKTKTDGSILALYDAFKLRVLAFNGSVDNLKDLGLLKVLNDVEHLSVSNKRLELFMQNHTQYTKQDYDLDTSKKTFNEELLNFLCNMAYVNRGGDQQHYVDYYTKTKRINLLRVGSLDENKPFICSPTNKKLDIEKYEILTLKTKEEKEERFFTVFVFLILQLLDFDNKEEFKNDKTLPLKVNEIKKKIMERGESHQVLFKQMVFLQLFYLHANPGDTCKNFFLTGQLDIVEKDDLKTHLIFMSLLFKVNIIVLEEKEIIYSGTLVSPEMNEVFSFGNNYKHKLRYWYNNKTNRMSLVTNSKNIKSLQKHLRSLFFEEYIVKDKKAIPLPKDSEAEQLENVFKKRKGLY